MRACVCPNYTSKIETVDMTEWVAFLSGDDGNNPQGSVKSAEYKWQGWSDTLTDTDTHYLKPSHLPQAKY